jgi:UPF0271 protein
MGSKAMVLVIDLNCDMGESFGAWRMGCDEELMNYVSSVNIACGFHAGDPSTIRRTVELAIRKKVAIGAHPSFPDLQGFGRREMKLSEQEIFDIVLYQVAALKGICEALGGRLHHVKPHGALYNQASKSPTIAKAIADAVKTIDSTLLLYGLSGSFLITEAKKIGLRTVSEVFADRTYQSDGTLTPRSLKNALIEDTVEATKQVIQMVKTQTVTARDGKVIPIEAETICIHGDSEKAIDFAITISSELRKNNIHIKAPS